MSEVKTHRMLPGSHERPSGPECLCGAFWDYYDDACIEGVNDE